MNSALHLADKIVFINIKAHALPEGAISQVGSIFLMFPIFFSPFVAVVINLFNVADIYVL